MPNPEELKWAVEKLRSEYAVPVTLRHINNVKKAETILAIAYLEQGDLLKRACYIHTQYVIYRYLMSNAHRRQDGAEKAQRHEELCRFYVALRHGVDPDVARRDHEDLYQAIHTATAALTSHMETEIGFPVNKTPDYDSLAPAFFEKFHAIAMRVIQ